MNRVVALVLAASACRLGAAAPAPERLRIESTRGPAAEPALLAELRADPIRLPDDPLVPKLSALRDRALIEVVNCHSNRRASLVGDRATCVDVLWAGERVRAWINSTSLNRATVGAGTSHARTVAISYTRETDERTMLWLDDHGRVAQRTRLSPDGSPVLSRSSALIGGDGWFTLNTGGDHRAPVDFRVAERGEVVLRGESRAASSGPCVAVRRGTICSDDSASRGRRLRFYPAGAEASREPRLPESLANLLSSTPIRVLLRLQETPEGADLALGFPFAAGGEGVMVVARLSADGSEIGDAREVDVSLVPREARRLCGAHAETWSVRYGEAALAISCGNQALVALSVRSALRRTGYALLLERPMTQGRYRLLPPVGVDVAAAAATVLYAHWCGAPPREGEGGDLCVSRIRVGSDVRELFRRRVRCWECWDASVGASATGDDRLLFGAADAEHNIIVVESMRVERDSVVTDWDAKYAGSHVEFLQASVVF